MMLGGLRVESIGRELVRALGDAEAIGRRRDRNRAAHPADRTGAAPRRGEAFGQRDGELDGAAVACAIEGDRLTRARVDQAATFSSASLTASSASFAFEPSGPPPCAMSGRPPPPCPPSVATAALTRSTALTWPARSSVTPTATLARPSLTATSAPMPGAETLLHLVNSGAQILGIEAFNDLAEELVTVDLLGRADLPTWRTAAHRQRFFASASSRSSRLRSSTSDAIRAGTSSGEDFRRRCRLAQLRFAIAQPSPGGLAGQRLDPPNARGNSAFGDDLQQLDVAQRAHVRAAAQLDGIVAVAQAVPSRGRGPHRHISRRTAPSRRRKWPRPESSVASSPAHCARICAFTSASTASISSRVSAFGCEKSKRK